VSREIIFPVSRRHGGFQPGATPRGLGTHSVRSALRLGPRVSPFRPAKKESKPVGCGRKRCATRYALPWVRLLRSPAMSASLRHRLQPQAPASPPARLRIIGPRMFWLSRVRAFLKDWRRDQGLWGERPVHDVLPHSEDRSADRRIAESLRRKERYKGPGFANLRNQVLSLIWSQSFVHYSEDAQSASVPGHLFLSPRPCSGSA